MLGAETDSAPKEEEEEEAESKSYLASFPSSF
jgi:hypothetical protein